MDRSVQNPNENNLIHVLKDRGKVAVTKRSMTRTIRETFNLFRSTHLCIQMGMTGFYILPPKWIQTFPHQQQCVCSHCANFDFVITALDSASSVQLKGGDLKAMSLCDEP